MLENIEEDYAKLPEQALVDSAYATKDSATQSETEGVAVISTVPRSEQLTNSGRDPHQP